MKTPREHKDYRQLCQVITSEKKKISRKGNPKAFARESIHNLPFPSGNKARRSGTVSPNTASSITGKGKKT